MSVYIASSFRLVEKVDAIAKELEKAGFKITVKWWAREYEVEGEGPVATLELKKRFMALSPYEFYSKPACKLSFEADYNGVLDADFFLFVADDEREIAFCGANVELGIAIGAGKPCFSVGRLRNCVLYYPVKRCRDVNHFISESMLARWG